MASDSRLAKNSEIKALLRAHRGPLINPRARMIVVFSPKSACTNVAVWFFHQLGHSRAAADYAGMIHRYRSQVYYRSNLYQISLERDLASFSLVRVVRDPYSRAASSFRHALLHGYADADIVKLTSNHDVEENGLSFREFLDLLERSDLRTCNPHYRQQRHPIEDQLPTRHLINVSTEDLYARLNDVEVDLGLPLTDFEHLEPMKRVEQKRRSDQMEAADCYQLRLTRDAARVGPWPRAEALLTMEARRRIARLYATDIASYTAVARDLSAEAGRGGS